jgi:3-hydroxyisobutyrate dehydrogenase-like beta-hydroxyacid dehydrogenase
MSSAEPPALDRNRPSSRHASALGFDHSALRREVAMSSETVALLHPGEMGAAVGACLTGCGHRVLWVAAGRSEATRARAAAAGLMACGGLEDALERAGMVLSICPPHAALAVARGVVDAGFRGLFVDGNAVAPSTVREIAAIVEQRGMRFVDGGIIGPPPTGKGVTRLYLSGTDSDAVAALFAGSKLEAVRLAGEVGTASALKMAYAAWTKGTVALLADIRALAQAEGVEGALLDEWNRSQPGVAAESDAVAAKARKAWRWVAEMEEIARSFEAVGLPGGFHHASADIYRRLAGFKDDAVPPIAAVIAAVRREVP